MKQTIKVFIRNLQRQTQINIIIIGGFALGFGVVFILASLLYHEISVDKHFNNLSNIYRVIDNDNCANICEDYKDYMLENYPEVVNACNIQDNYIKIKAGNNYYDCSIVLTDPSFFEIFSIKNKWGIAKEALKNKFEVAVTPDFAQRIYGRNNPIGETFELANGDQYTIAAVVDPVPENTSFYYEIILNTKNRIGSVSNSSSSKGNFFYSDLIVQLLPGISTELLAKKFSEDLADKKIPEAFGFFFNDTQEEQKDKGIWFLPFKKSYFTKDLKGNNLKQANLDMINILSVIVILIIVLSIFNYINLTTANQFNRLKEFGIKKTVGAKQKSIIGQLIQETFLICIISSFVGILIALVLKSFLHEIIGQEIYIKLLFKPFGILMLMGIVFLISLLSGILPSLLTLKIKPIRLLNKSVTSHKSINLRPVLSIIQFTVTIGLIISLIVIAKQLHYIKSKNFGFTTNQLVIVSMPDHVRKKAYLLKDELEKIPDISSVCMMGNTFGDVDNTSSGGVNDFYVKYINHTSSDTNFLNVFNIPLIEGRMPLKSELNECCFINETAMKSFGWDHLQVREIFRNNKVIGVVKDFHYQDMRSAIGPLYIKLNEYDHANGFRRVIVKINPNDIPLTMKKIERIWNELYPGIEFQYDFYDEWLDTMYKKEDTLAKAISLFAIIAIIISSIGILGMVIFSSQRRIKEIGVRKVVGAKVGEIITMLNMDIIKWIIISFLIACPVAITIMKKWLESFAYKTALSWWIFALAGVSALTIALITISIQSWKAAGKNPVEALRYE